MTRPEKLLRGGTNGIPVNFENGYRAMWGDYNGDGWPSLCQCRTNVPRHRAVRRRRGVNDPRRCSLLTGTIRPVIMSCGKGAGGRPSPLLGPDGNDPPERRK